MYYTYNVAVISFVFGTDIKKKYMHIQLSGYCRLVIFINLTDIMTFHHMMKQSNIVNNSRFQITLVEKKS